MSHIILLTSGNTHSTISDYQTRHCLQQPEGNTVGNLICGSLVRLARTWNHSSSFATSAVRQPMFARQPQLEEATLCIDTPQCRGVGNIRLILHCTEIVRLYSPAALPRRKYCVRRFFVRVILTLPHYPPKIPQQTTRQPK